VNQTRSRVPAAGIPGTAATVVIWILLLLIQRAFAIPSFRLANGWRVGMSLLFAIDAVLTIIWGAITLSQARQQDALAMIGPYAMVRHPIYGAILWSGTAAVSFAFESWLVLTAVVPLHFLWIRLVQQEEAELQERFGEEYTRYATETGQFLPRLASLRRAAQGEPPKENGQ
jgi:protein-S-isoprenylcysteine O-methyltransferase Ste14